MSLNTLQNIQLFEAASIWRSLQIFTYSRNVLKFTEPVSALPCSQKPATCFYTEPVESSPCPPILLPWSPFQHHPAIYTCVHAVFPRGLPTKILHSFLFDPMRITCPTKLILLYLITPLVCGEKHKHEASNSAFSPASSQVLSPTYIQKSSSASWSPTLSRHYLCILGRGYPDWGFSVLFPQL